MKREKDKKGMGKGREEKNEKSQEVALYRRRKVKGKEKMTEENGLKGQETRETLESNGEGKRKIKRVKKWRCIDGEWLSMKKR